MPKALVATPLIDGRADREFVSGMISSQGLYYAWACVEGQSHISLARDLLASQFLASDCDRLVFIDGDIGFSRPQLARLLGAARSLVSGLYPAKTSEMPWTFRADARDASALAGGSTPGDDGLLPVRYVPCGFLSVDRRVFDDLLRGGRCARYVYRGQELHHFFQSGVVDGVFLSEDFFFSHLARAAGHPAFVDPEIRLRHVGRAVYQRDNDASPLGRLVP